MKRLLILLLMAGALASPAFAVDPAPSPVILPSGPPVPVPPPLPKLPTKLSSDQIYLIRSSVELTVIDGTEGIVTITPATGPMTIRGKFTDGTGVETRTLTDKYLYLVTANGSGKTDLIITWPMNKLRVCLDVGDAPPPPPPVPTDPLTTALQTAYALDADADRATSLAYLQLVYAGMAKQVPVTIKTNQGAFTWITSVVRAPTGLNAVQVQNLRKAIATELSSVLGTGEATPLVPGTLSLELAKISQALAGVK